LTVGRVGRAHGVGGEVRVEVLTDFPERRYRPGARLWARRPGGDPSRELEVATSRGHEPWLLVRFVGVSDRNAAQALTRLELSVPSADAAPLEQGEYYVHQLIGLEVVTTSGEPVGRVTGFMETGAADVVVVSDPGGLERLVPLAAPIVRAVDLAAGRLTVDPPAGLLD
jgi:16S rRNA processing protein RimM